MSQNNTIKKSDKKFIRLEKGRIRARVLDTKKQQELIDNLYQRFLGAPAVVETKSEVKKEVKVKPKKEKTSKK